MKAFSLWLFKLCWRREIAHSEWASRIEGFYGKDYDEGLEDGINYALETLHLKELK